MKKLIVIYGLLAGLISSAGFMLAIPANGQTIDFSGGQTIGFSLMFLGFTLIVVAGYQLRARQAQPVSFGRFFTQGLIISLIATVVYCSAWEVYYQNLSIDYGQQYLDYQVNLMEEQGKDPLEIEQSMADQAAFFETYKNNRAVRLGVTSLEILPVGVLVGTLTALLFGVFMRKKPQEV